VQESEIKELLKELQSLPSENEWVEFKVAKDNFDFNKLGKYFSALSNEANLKNEKYGWLVFGVDNKTRNIVGTSYRKDKVSLDKLKLEIANKTTGRITFIEIYELFVTGGRVIIFQIPAAPPGIPIAWENHYYGREGESINALNIQEIEQIRDQTKHYDWSAQLCESATINDLDPKAITKARDEFKKKNSTLSDEVDQWDDITFLNKAKITIQGKITRAAIVLLGKAESEHFLTPSVARISWILKDKEDIEIDYEHFAPPFILNTELVLAKIRNLKYRYLLDDTLFPIEITKYEPYVIREALHNCIAHQDYDLRGRITVVEKPDELIFTNLGKFIPGSVEIVIAQDAPQKYYRNHFLSSAMVNFNMIDIIGSGIKKMFMLQRKRSFPLPTYFFDSPDEVTVRIVGKVIDENYTRLLMEKTDLDIKTVICLDKVQKKQKLSVNEYKLLKKHKLVEGRYPNVFVTSKIAAVTGDKTAYIKYRAFDDSYYKHLVLSFIKKYGSASRKEIDNLLIGKLSDVLTDEQKMNKVRNLLYFMSKKDKSIKNVGSAKKPKWILVNNI